MSIKNRILTIEKKCNYLKTPYYRDNIDNSFDKLCRTDKELEWDINCLVYYLDFKKNPSLLELTEPELVDIGERLLSTMYTGDEYLYYSYPEEFIKRLTKFVWPNDEKNNVNIDEVKFLVTKHHNNKYENIKLIYLIVRDYIWNVLHSEDKKSPRDFFINFLPK